jgi:transposase
MRTQIVNQMHALLITAPADLRDRLRTMTVSELITTASGLRPGPITSTTAATKLALRGLAARHQVLSDELDVLDTELSRLTVTTAPALCALMGVGSDVAGALLVAAGANPERLRSEAAFASLCGAAPVPASSGKTNRRRLSRGGDRQANCALWRIVMVRMSWHQPTRDYVKRRTTEGMSKREIMRCLKRYVA